MDTPVAVVESCSASSIYSVLAGGLWLSLGAAKLLDPAEFHRYLARLLGTGALSAIVSWMISGGEVAMGTWMIAGGLWKRNRAGVLLWCSSSAALATVFIGLFHSPDVPCGCFGSSIEATRDRRLVVGGALLFLSLAALGPDKAAGRRASAGAGTKRVEGTRE